jgi:hypothetical protein
MNVDGGVDEFTNLALDPESIKGAGTVQGVVSRFPLVAGAPPRAEMVVKLSSSDTSHVKVPPSVTIPC